MSKPIDQELLPCPFCGKEPAPYHKGVGCMTTGCVLSGLHLDYDKWQARAAVQPAGVAVPEGWKLVPIKPTAEMKAVCRVAGKTQVWADMIAASPAAPHPVSGEQKAPSVQITGHLDEVDAPVWPFINGEARKLGPLTGSIDTYNFTRPDGAQPNGVVAVLWNGMSIHALALTVRDSLNRTQCVRLLATPPAAQDVAGLVEALEQVERWDGFPNTGKKWPESGEPMSYSACYGSNGERDFMRQLAAKALVAHRAQQGEPS